MRDAAAGAGSVDRSSDKEGSEGSLVVSGSDVGMEGLGGDGGTGLDEMPFVVLGAGGVGSGDDLLSFSFLDDEERDRLFKPCKVSFSAKGFLTEELGGVASPSLSNPGVSLR